MVAHQPFEREPVLLVVGGVQAGGFRGREREVGGEVLVDQGLHVVVHALAAGVELGGLAGGDDEKGKDVKGKKGGKCIHSYRCRRRRRGGGRRLWCH